MSDVLDFATVMGQFVSECGYTATEDSDGDIHIYSKPYEQVIGLLHHKGDGLMTVVYFDGPNYDVPFLPVLAVPIELFLGDAAWLEKFKTLMVKSIASYEEGERGHA